MDLSAVRSRAVPEGDHFRISGQKIFITYGEHDLANNIIHLVLARIPGAPDGTRGISLFVVPKYLVNADGSWGQRNDVHCVSIEHKLGIHASPTAVMSYGDNDGAIGYLVGEENRGLMYIFTMMDSARDAVGLEGVAIGEAAYQHALKHARERIQGTLPAGGERVPIIEHPDVKRMLMMMKSQVEAMRALVYLCATEYDIALRHPDPQRREHGARRGDLLTPIVKGWSTETGQQLASLGLQVHGGMGYVEETGAAQYMRDVRITTIYEGTTGIQAGDLVGRKTFRDGGQGAPELIADMRATIAEPAPQALGRICGALERSHSTTSSRSSSGCAGRPRIRVCRRRQRSVICSFAGLYAAAGCWRSRYGSLRVNAPRRAPTAPFMPPRSLRRYSMRHKSCPAQGRCVWR